MDWVDLPEDQGCFMELMQETCKSNPVLSSQLIYDLWNRLKKCEEENQDLVETNRQIKFELEKTKHEIKKVTKEGLKMDEEAIEREKDLNKKIKLLSLKATPKQNECRNEANLKKEVEELKKNNEFLNIKINQLKQRINHQSLPTHQNQLVIDSQLDLNNINNDLKKKIKKEQMLKSEYYRENKVLKNFWKLCEVKKNDCNYHVNEKTTRENDSKFLNFKQNYFN
jgi:structural maintenance of chromosome 1